MKREMEVSLRKSSFMIAHTRPDEGMVITSDLTVRLDPRATVYSYQSRIYTSRPTDAFGFYNLRISSPRFGAAARGRS